MKPHSVYIHFPFCEQRCNYCDFNTTAGKQAYISEYIDALCLEIEKTITDVDPPIPVHSVYIGGGTPSLAPLCALEKVMGYVTRCFNLDDDTECSLEANPGTVTPEYLQGLHSLGFQRLSLGMQSADDGELRLLGRIHVYDDVVNAVQWAREAGFTNLNLDLIYGLPGQTVKKWQENLKKAIDLAPEHLSLYALTLEPHVPMFGWIQERRYTLPEDDEVADMYEAASSQLEAAGFKQYEISNWAIAGKDNQTLVCRHNMQYWRNFPYFGFGAGAHGALQGLRLENVKPLSAYLRRCLHQNGKGFPFSPATKTITHIDRRREMQETMMLGLRLTAEGVSRANFLQRFGEPMESVFGKEIDWLFARGLVEESADDADRIRLTNRGRFVSNQVFLLFVD